MQDARDLEDVNAELVETQEIAEVVVVHQVQCYAASALHSRTHETSKCHSFITRVIQAC